MWRNSALFGAACPLPSPLRQLAPEQQYASPDVQWDAFARSDQAKSTKAVDQMFVTKEKSCGTSMDAGL
jgi:hypothetical protein